MIADELRNFLSSYLGDQPTEVGLREVVFVTADHPGYHREILTTLDQAIATADDPSIARAIEDSFAASAGDPAEARAYLEGIRDEYLRQYTVATGGAN